MHFQCGSFLAIGLAGLLITPAPGAVPDIAVPAPAGGTRLTAGAALEPPSAAPGEAVTLSIKIRVASGCWIYALANSGSGNLPTSIEVPPELLRGIGPWRSPKPKVKEDGSRTLTGEVLFQRRFLVQSGAVERGFKIPITIRYQMCNEAACWPPAKISLETKPKSVGSKQPDP